MQMGRAKTVNKNLPPRLFVYRGKRVTTYYYVPSTGSRRKIPLGRDLNDAKRQWAELEGQVPPQPDTFAAVAERYKREVLPTKAPGTQHDNLREIEQLNKVFGKVPIDQIKPKHVRRYLDLRSPKAKVRANREKALLSHIFNTARAWGITDSPNPCAGIKGNKETGRDRYVEDWEFQAVWESAHFAVQDALDLALLTGQRPADVLKFKRTDIKDGALWLQQGKTGKRLGVKIVGHLSAVISRILARLHKVGSLYLIQDEDGQPLTYWALHRRFKQAAQRAGVDFQFRDIRAKTATDTGDLARAQKLLGHKTRTMTEHYTRNRKGEKVEPLK